MVVFALGKNLLFKSALGHCDISVHSYIPVESSVLAFAADDETLLFDSSAE